MRYINPRFTYLLTLLTYFYFYLIHVSPQNGQLFRIYFLSVPRSRVNTRIIFVVGVRQTGKPTASSATVLGAGLTETSVTS